MIFRIHWKVETILIQLLSIAVHSTLTITASVKGHLVIALVLYGYGLFPTEKPRATFRPITIHRSLSNHLKQQLHLPYLVPALFTGFEI